MPLAGLINRRVISIELSSSDALFIFMYSFHRVAMIMKQIFHLRSCASREYNSLNASSAHNTMRFYWLGAMMGFSKRWRFAEANLANGRMSAISDDGQASPMPNNLLLFTATGGDDAFSPALLALGLGAELLDHLYKFHLRA